jgi:hypothetical protein
MKSLLALPLIMLGISGTVRAQELPVSATSISAPAIVTPSTPQPAEDEAATHAANLSEPALLAFSTPRPSLAALSFAAPTATSAPASSAAPPADPPSAPQTNYRYNERDYRLEIAIGVAIVRFRSSVYYATGVGTHTAAAYYLKDWLAVEGAVTTAFAPTVFANENVKYLGYAGGAKISGGRARFEPWLHVLAGGIHVIPQTALGGKNGFEVTAGLGVDYGLTPRVSLRAEGDYLRSHVFGEWQNNAQAIAAVVVHF